MLTYQDVISAVMANEDISFCYYCGTKHKGLRDSPATDCIKCGEAKVLHVSNIMQRISS